MACPASTALAQMRTAETRRWDTLCSLKYSRLNKTPCPDTSGHGFRHVTQSRVRQDDPGIQAGRCDRRGTAQGNCVGIHADRTGDGGKAPVRFCNPRPGPHKPGPGQETEVFAVRDFRYTNVLRAGDQRVTGTPDTGRDLPRTLGEGAGPDLAPVSRAGGPARSDRKE